MIETNCDHKSVIDLATFFAMSSQTDLYIYMRDCSSTLRLTNSVSFSGQNCKQVCFNYAGINYSGISPLEREEIEVTSLYVTRFASSAFTNQLRKSPSTPPLYAILNRIIFDRWDTQIFFIFSYKYHTTKTRKPLSRTNFNSDCFAYLLDPMRILFPTNMVRAQVQEILRMRKKNTNRAVPLDAVPERRTERCSPRFRPGDRFCEPSFRYLSPGIEGEKCRPLDHLWQIPFIHSARSIPGSNSDLYRTVF